MAKEYQLRGKNARQRKRNSYYPVLFSFCKLLIQRDKCCNPVYAEEDGQDNYPLIEEPAVPYKASPPLWNNEYSQAA